MKKAYRYLIFFVIIMFLILLMGCNTVDNIENSIEATHPTSENVIYKEKREEFNKQSEKLKEERNQIISDFLENPENVYTLIENLRVNEDKYIELWKFSKNLSKSDYEDVIKLFDMHQIHDGLNIVYYHEVGDMQYASYEFGTYTIKNRNEVEVVWVQNVEIYFENEKKIKYKVINQENDAFLILKGNTGYWLVEIESIFAKKSYEREMFDVYYDFLQREKEEILLDFLRNPVITSNFLQELHENENGYARLLNSVKYLPQEDYYQIMLLVEINQWRDGIQTVEYEKQYYQKYFRYVDGEFIISSETSMEVVWKQNFEEPGEDATYNTIYKIKDKKEDAYLLLKRGTEHQLFRIIGINSSTN